MLIMALRHTRALGSMNSTLRRATQTLYTPRISSSSSSSARSLRPFLSQARMSTYASFKVPKVLNEPNVSSANI